MKRRKKETICLNCGYPHLTSIQKYNRIKRCNMCKINKSSDINKLKNFYNNLAINIKKIHTNKTDKLK